MRYYFFAVLILNLSLALASPRLAAQQGTPLPAHASAASTSAVSAQAVSAQAPATESAAALSLERLREMALEKSPALRSAMLETDSTVLAEKIRSQELLPSISVRGGVGASYAIAGAAQASVTASVGVSETIYDGGKHRVLAQIDALSTLSARNAAKSAYFSALRSVDSAYYDYLEAEASVEAARADVQAAALRLELAKAKAEAGRASRTDLLQADALAATKETALSQATKVRAVARARLVALAGIAPAAAIAKVDFSAYERLVAAIAALSEAQVEAFADRAVSLSRTGNLPLAAAAIARERAEKEAELAKLTNAPNVSASFSYGLGYGVAAGLDLGTPSLSLSATLAIAPWSAAATSKKADIAVSRAFLAQAEIQSSQDLAVRETIYGLCAAARALGSSALSLDYSNGNYEGVLERFKRSVASSTELSEAEALASGARKGLIGARYALLRLASELSLAAGMEDEGLLARLLP